MWTDDYFNHPDLISNFNRGQLQANSQLQELVEMLANGTKESDLPLILVAKMIDTVSCLEDGQPGKGLGFLAFIAYQALRHSCHQFNQASEQASSCMNALLNTVGNQPQSNDLPPKA